MRTRTIIIPKAHNLPHQIDTCPRCIVKREVNPTFARQMKAYEDWKAGKLNADPD